MKPSRSLPVLARERDLQLKARLLAMSDSVEPKERLLHDPLGIVHEAQGDANREVVGLIAALLAFGNVTQIRRSIRRVLDVLGESPAAFLEASSEREVQRALKGFVHRVYVGADVAQVLIGVRTLRRTHGSLDAAFTHFASDEALEVPTFAASHARLFRGLAGFGAALRGEGEGRGLQHLVPDAQKGSACKRLLLYLRWMCRPNDGVDLGLFHFPAAELLIPVDTHVHRIATNLGLTKRRDASFRTAIEITSALAKFDAEDPVRFDFALCHLGISGACPSRREDEACGACAMKPHCVHWPEKKKRVRAKSAAR
jgi:uncharacterized protein (TIGR02757 family)